MDSETFWILKIQEAQHVARLTSEVRGKWSVARLTSEVRGKWSARSSYSLFSLVFRHGEVGAKWSERVDIDQ